MSFRYTIETENPIVTDGNKMFNCKDGKLRLKIVDANPWHTGTPTEEGWYLLAYGDNFYCANYWQGNSWRHVWGGTLLAWQKIEPYKEKS